MSICAQTVPPHAKRQAERKWSRMPRRGITRFLMVLPSCLDRTELDPLVRLRGAVVHCGSLGEGRRDRADLRLGDSAPRHDAGDKQGEGGGTVRSEVSFHDRAFVRKKSWR